MNVRHILVAASAAAILAGTSFGALAGSYGVSKGQSSSSIHVVAKAYPADEDHHGGPPKMGGFGFGWDKPQPQSIVIVDGHGWQKATAPNGGSAGADSKTWGGGLAASVDVNIGRGVGGSGTIAIAAGGTSGSACAGSACDSD